MPTQTTIIESHRLGVLTAKPDKIRSSASTCPRPSGPYRSIRHAARDVFGDNADKVLSLGDYVFGCFQCYSFGGTLEQDAVPGITEDYDVAYAKALAQALTIFRSSTINVGSLPGLPRCIHRRFPPRTTEIRP